MTAEVSETAPISETTRDNGQDSTETTCVCKGNKCQQTLSELYIKYDSLKRSLKQLREHLMNIEVHGDEISQLKQYENATQESQWSNQCRALQWATLHDQWQTLACRHAV